MDRIVLVHPFLLHYHYARLQALAEACRKTGVSMISLELASYSDQYRSLIQGQESGFDNRVLFHAQSLEQVGAREMWLAAESALAELRPDVIFIYGYSLDVMRRIRSWGEQNGAGVVLISDSNEFDRTRYWPFERLKSRFVSRVDAGFAGGLSSSLYLQKLGLPQERIRAGYDVVDNEAFWRRTCESRSLQSQVRERWGLPAGYFLYVGRLIKEKNLERLLAAYERYVGLLGSGATPWDLVICGSGPGEEALRRIASRMPQQVQAHIRFSGLVKQPELTDFYACASCLVLPSISESWGLVVNEAMACGLPVLVSKRAGCAADFVKEGQTGWLLHPHDTGQMARTMAGMHQMDAEARVEMGEQARRVIAGWGLDRFCQGVLESARIAVNYRRQRQGHGG